MANTRDLFKEGNKVKFIGSSDTTATTDKIYIVQSYEKFYKKYSGLFIVNIHTYVPIIDNNGDLNGYAYKWFELVEVSRVEIDYFAITKELAGG